MQVASNSFYQNNHLFFPKWVKPCLTRATAVSGVALAALASYHLYQFNQIPWAFATGSAVLVNLITLTSQLQASNLTVFKTIIVANLLVFSGWSMGMVLPLTYALMLSAKESLLNNDWIGTGYKLVFILAIITHTLPAIMEAARKSYHLLTDKGVNERLVHLHNFFQKLPDSFIYEPLFSNLLDEFFQNLAIVIKILRIEVVNDIVVGLHGVLDSIIDDYYFLVWSFLPLFISLTSLENERKLLLSYTKLDQLLNIIALITFPFDSSYQQRLISAIFLYIECIPEQEQEQVFNTLRELSEQLVTKFFMEELYFQIFESPRVSNTIRQILDRSHEVCEKIKNDFFLIKQMEVNDQSKESNEQNKKFFKELSEQYSLFTFLNRIFPYTLSNISNCSTIDYQSMLKERLKEIESVACETLEFKLELNWIKIKECSNKINELEENIRTNIQDLSNGRAPSHDVGALVDNFNSERKVLEDLYKENQQLKDNMFPQLLREVKLSIDEQDYQNFSESLAIVRRKIIQNRLQSEGRPPEVVEPLVVEEPLVEIVNSDPLDISNDISSDKDSNNTELSEVNGNKINFIEVSGIIHLIYQTFIDSGTDENPTLIHSLQHMNSLYRRNIIEDKVEDEEEEIFSPYMALALFPYNFKQNDYEQMQRSLDIPSLNQMDELFLSAGLKSKKKIDEICSPVETIIQNLKAELITELTESYIRMKGEMHGVADHESFSIIRLLELKAPADVIRNDLLNLIEKVEKRKTICKYVQKKGNFHTFQTAPSSINPVEENQTAGLTNQATKLEKLAQKVALFIFRIVNTGAILLPVLLHPLAATFGLGVGACFYAFIRFGSINNGVISKMVNFTDKLITLIHQSRLFKLTFDTKHELRFFSLVRTIYKIKMINFQILSSLLMRYPLFAFTRGFALSREIIIERN